MRNIQNDPTLKNVSMLKPYRQLLLFLIGLLGLMLLAFVIQVVMQMIAKSVAPTEYDYEVFTSSATASMIVNGLSYLTLGVIFIFLIKDESNEVFKTFKNWKGYVAAAIGVGAILFFNFFYNLILVTAGAKITDNANESSLNSIITTFPFTSLFLFALIGPACEELTYRLGLFSLLRRFSRILAYVVTIIAFTLIHFDFTSTTMSNELLNIPFYAFAAFVFTYLYDHYGFASSLSSHVTNNVLSILASILTIIKL